MTETKPMTFLMSAGSLKQITLCKTNRLLNEIGSLHKIVSFSPNILVLET